MLDPDKINADPQPCCIWFLVADGHAMFLFGFQEQTRLPS
jgi:hypothetical protein